MVIVITKQDADKLLQFARLTFGEWIIGKKGGYHSAGYNNRNFRLTPTEFIKGGWSAQIEPGKTYRIKANTRYNFRIHGLICEITKNQITQELTLKWLPPFYKPISTKPNNPKGMKYQKDTIKIKVYNYLDYTLKRKEMIIKYKAKGYDNDRIQKLLKKQGLMCKKSHIETIENRLMCKKSS